jgi:hypothetical protein
MGELFIEYFVQRFPLSAGLFLLAASGALWGLSPLQDRADIPGPALFMIWVAIVGLALGGCTVFAFGVRSRIQSA